MQLGFVLQQSCTQKTGEKKTPSVMQQEQRKRWQKKGVLYFTLFAVT